jgi:hypothetical protein
LKKILKILWPFFFPISIVLFLLFSFKVLKYEYQFAYQSANVYQGNFPWSKQIFFSEIIKFKNKIFDKKYQTDLPKLNILINEQNSRKLLNNLPASTKKWVDASINYPYKKIDLQNIKMRYRGDNPVNWLNEKKEFRIKTSRNKLIDGYRYFDYKKFKAVKYLTYYLSDQMNLINQNYNLVEVYINGESHGLYIEQEKIDESFLRRNKLMPVNIYKGENHATEHYVGLNRNLFNNPNMWSKIAIFNQSNEHNTEDISKFLKTLKSNKYHSDPTINDYIDLNYFSRLDALLTITGNIHHDYFHNMRLILDPWNGKVTQLISDPQITSRDNLKLDLSSNDLGTFLNKNTIYIHKKYQWIYYFLQKEDVIEKVKFHKEKIQEKLSIVQKKEPYDARGKNHVEDFNNYLSKLEKNKRKLLKILNSNPKSSWNKSNKNFYISIDDFTPLYKLKIKFKKDETPKWIGVDLNYDNFISKKEPKFIINQKLSEVELPLIFYSNRFKKNNYISTTIQNYEINHSNTYFNFITSNKAYPSKIESKNFFNKKFFIIQKQNINAVKSNISNNIIFLKKKTYNNKISLGGIINVNENLIFNKEVEIQSGTKFFIKPNKHIVFKKKVTAYGTKEKPIIFKKFENQKKPWGSVAIIGKNEENSLLNNVIFSGGSGGNFNQYKFTSMLSIHNTNNLSIMNSKFLFNELFDDTIHIIYSSNITLENIIIKNANGDAIDVDISDNIFLRNISIMNSNNDGVDFMKSDALIENLEVFNSKDKGVSIGENSKIIIKDSLIKNNKIGAAVKDNSKSNFFNVNFLDNNIQLAGYAKNWRYGKGGNIKVFNSVIKAKENKFVTSMDPDDFFKKKDKNLIQNSKIKLIETEIIGANNILGENVLILKNNDQQ